MKASTGIRSKITRLPVHVAIVPDGNGRWAEQRGLPRLAGHQAGVQKMRALVEYLNEWGIKYVTLYGFSTENWGRPREEVEGLFRILKERIEKDVPKLHRKGVKVRHLGRLQDLPAWLQRSIKQAEELTKNNTGMTLSLAFNYGGHLEIVDAVRRIVADGIPPEKIDEKLFSSYLYTAGLPDVDLLIRTGDELRLSNFLIWQTAYSEYYFTQVLWPDFTKEDIDKALLAYSQRERRFGAL
ncbi:MAG TPA: di-trans,poly-cis-decaprenylcistransferase [Dehalococcoidia bacterium]|jgi:undecaprenyl diphosphate synthase|nr:di-trans,poly-cis-decaprenylcistransferase [Dehalococcoidia bacterium]